MIGNNAACKINMFERYAASHIVQAATIPAIASQRSLPSNWGALIADCKSNASDVSAIR